MKISELRGITNERQEDVAKKLRITRATYANYETGKTEAPIETLCQIADYYGVSLDYLCEHHTNNLLDLSGKTTEFKNLINIIANFDDKKIINLTGYAIRLAQE